jgi:hypothetical protein
MVQNLFLVTVLWFFCSVRVGSFAVAQAISSMAAELVDAGGDAVAMAAVGLELWTG